MDDKNKDKKEIDELFEELKDGEQDEEGLSEFFQKLEKKINKRKNNNRIAYMFGFLTSPNILLHFLITLVLNFSIMFALQGFFNLAVYDKLSTYVLVILIFTAVEFIIKALSIRFLLKIILSTVGIFFLILIVLYFILLDKFYPNFTFDSSEKLIIFIIAFWGIRYLLTRVLITYIVGKIAKRQLRKEGK